LTEKGKCFRIGKTIFYGINKKQVSFGKSKGKFSKSYKFFLI